MLPANTLYSHSLRTGNPRPCPVHIAVRARRAAIVVVKSSMTSSAKLTTPSNRTGANELEALESVTTCVPDTMMTEALDGSRPAAATVSFNLLEGTLAAQRLGNSPIKNCILSALAYDHCAGLRGMARLECALDKALVNVAALLAEEIAQDGRVAINVDPRLANDTNAIIAKVKMLSGMCGEAGLPESRLLWRVPATYAALQAVKQLEAAGHTTHVYYVYSIAQGVAAMQAGASVLQPSVGTLREWYDKNPGAIRDPKGPREDSGARSSVDPGVRLVKQLYSYAKAYHPKTKIMASGIRTRDDAMAVAGVDFILLPSRVASALSAIVTVQGYNDGLHATASADAMPSAGMDIALSAESAKAMAPEKMPSLVASEAVFTSAVTAEPAAAALTRAGLAGGVADAEALIQAMQSLAPGTD